MKPLRLRIAWLMAFVAFVALDLASIRAVLDRPRSTTFLLGLGAVPMANVLLAGLFVGRRRRRDRGFVVGFEAFGTIALACYIVSACSYARELLIPYIWAVHTPTMLWIDRWTGMSHYPYAVTYYLSLAVLLSLPLLGFAVAGGLMCRWLAGGARCWRSPKPRRNYRRGGLRRPPMGMRYSEKRDRLGDVIDLWPSLVPDANGLATVGPVA